MSAIGPGDRVVCVDARAHPQHGQPALVVGRSYIVESVNVPPTPGLVFGGCFAFQLCGVRCAAKYGFAAERFRPFDDGDSQRLIERLGVDMDIRETEDA